MNDRVWNGTRTKPLHFHKFNESGLAVCNVRLRPRDRDFLARDDLQRFKHGTVCSNCAAKDGADFIGDHCVWFDGTSAKMRG